MYGRKLHFNKCTAILICIESKNALIRQNETVITQQSTQLSAETVSFRVVILLYTFIHEKNIVFRAKVTDEIKS